MYKEERKILDCRWFPSDNKCTLAISGTEEEVLRVAMDHAMKCHGEKESPELREKLRKLLKDAKEEL